jgi:UDP-glucose 4-epimerase
MKQSGNTILITGGTGSMGRAIASLLPGKRYEEVRILSRSAAKQEEMKRVYQKNKTVYPFFRFIQGDITDRETLRKAIEGCSEVIHTAAMKDIVRCEEYPLNAMKVNVDAPLMLLEESIRSGVRKVVMVSTDKAVFPSSVMGMTKALMERAALKIACQQRDKAKEKRTILCIIRPGNLLGSAGTVLPIFIRQAKEGKHLTVTDPAMTRFLMTPADAARYAIDALEHTKENTILIKQALTYSIGALARAVLKLYSPLYSENPDKGITITGARAGEKKSETMASAQEIQSACKAASRQPEEESYFFFGPEIDCSDANKAFEHTHTYCSEGFSSDNGIPVSEQQLIRIISDYENNNAI